MDDPVAMLAQRGLALSHEERSRLVNLLLDSLNEPSIEEVEAAWGAAIERRLGEHERGEVKSIASEDVFAKIKGVAK